MSALEEFQWRGLVYETTDGLSEHLDEKQVTLYVGFDPTASSLHVGNLVPLLGLARMQRAGHCPIALVGGGTGMIGDPSGKSEERNLLTPDVLAENKAAVREQLGRLLDFESKAAPARLIDNADWLCEVSLIDFLRDVGKHFTVNSMLAKDAVKSRLEGPGISYTEFSYLLLQAWDFAVLNQRYGCTLQAGGSDQWGNITAGIHLMKRLRGADGHGAKGHGLVMPLITTSTGAKFGKTEAGAVWLDAERTSPYRFFQYWLNTTDADVVPYLKYFTFLDQGAIAELAHGVETDPAARAAQLRLATLVTAMIHGETAADRARRSSEVLFGGGALDELAAADALEIFDDVPSHRITADAFGDAMPLLDLLVESGLAPSKKAARRLVREGGAYVNNRRMNDEQASVARDAFLDGQVLVLRKGQKSYHLITLEA